VTHDSGQTWHKPNYGKSGPGKVRSVTINERNPTRIDARYEPIDVFVSTDIGQNWERLDSVWDAPSVSNVTYPVAGVEPHVRQIVLDPNDPKVIYVALQVGSIARSSNGGSTWEVIAGGVVNPEGTRQWMEIERCSRRSDAHQQERPHTVTYGELRAI
jgi:photosystem II stability/assembly factor-like uncharacterized protein